MATELGLPEMAARVRPDRLEARLVEGGWRLATKSHGGRMKVYELGGARAFLPLDPTFDDYPLCMLEAIQALAKAEGRELAGLTSEMVAPPVDKYQFRYESGSTKDGTLPLAVGSRFVRSCARMWTMAERETAAGSSNGTPLKARPSRENVRLGQTMAGSYVVTILARAAPGRLGATANHAPERRIGARLMNALRRVSSYTALTPRETIVGTPDKPLDTTIAESMEAIERAERNVRVEIAAQWPGEPGAEGDAPKRVVFGDEALGNAARVRALLIDTVVSPIFDSRSILSKYAQ